MTYFNPLNSYVTLQVNTNLLPKVCKLFKKLYNNNKLNFTVLLIRLTYPKTNTGERAATLETNRVSRD